MAIRDQIEAELTPMNELGIGIGESTVELELAPGQEALAAQIRSRFDNEVSISVGLTNYCGMPGRSPVCSSMPTATPLPSGLDLSLTLARPTVRSGDFGKAALVVYNNGPGVFGMDTGEPLVAQLVRPGTRRVVGTLGIPTAGIGYGVPLNLGQSETIPVLFGTARCDGGIGSAMPPGLYAVLVYIHPEGGAGPFYYAPQVLLLVNR
jgi:hypothetical protein